jgi:hypothetical protein
MRFRGWRCGDGEFLVLRVTTEERSAARLRDCRLNGDE